MKNIYDMKQYRTRSNAVILRVLALLVLSCVGASAMADSYHLLFKYSNENPSNFDDVGEGTDVGSGTYAWTVTLPANQNGNYYFGVSTSSSYVNLIAFYTSNVTNNTTEIERSGNHMGNQPYNVGDVTYHFVYINRTNTSAAYTMRILFSYDNNTPSFTLEDAVSCSMQIKHSWNGGSQIWQTMTNAGSNVYTYVGQYGGSGVCQISNDAGASNTQYSATVTGSPTIGDHCTFTFTSTGSCATSGGTMEITKRTTTDYYAIGNGAASGGGATNLKNWCGSVYWVKNSDTNMMQIGASTYTITYSDVYNTDGSTHPEFKIRLTDNDIWYDDWDRDTSDSNGNTIDTKGDNSNIRICLAANKHQNITITFNGSKTQQEGRIHVKCSDVATLPEIYIGEKPQKDGNTLTGSVYLAQTGGATVTDIKVYYAKDAEPNVASSPYVTLTGPFACGNLYNFTIDDICTIGSGDYQIKAQATNSAGSQASDVVAFNNFVCCPGSIEAFTLQAEAESVVAGESYGFFTTIEGGGANPTYMWEVKIGDGEWQTQVSTLKDMYYLVPPGTAGGTEITVRVTATGSNCGDTKTRTTKIILCYTPEITSFTVPTYTGAWESTAFTAGINNASSYTWSAMPAATITDATATGANFRATPGKYSITLTVGESSCNTTVSETKTIEVRPDHDTCGQ